MKQGNASSNGQRWKGYSGKIKLSTKLLYGLGTSATGIKDGLFQVFLLIYFNQVLGLDARLAGTALLIALLFDAISDTWVGLLSDNWRSSKWGRRHPFLLMSAIPLGIFTYLLFAPPSGLTNTQLFLWMTSFTILLRFALTFFSIPHNALGAELTTNYSERTSITSFRFMISAFVTPIIMVIGFLFFFAEAKGGLQYQPAYPSFAMLCGVLMIVFILISAFGTRHVIPTLPQSSSHVKRYTIWELLANLKLAIKMKSFVSLVLYTIVVYIAIGIGTKLTTYFMEYYFELSTTEMAFLPIASGLGGIFMLMLYRWIERKLDKKRGAILATVIFAFFFSWPYNARILGIFPENGDPNLILFYVMSLTIGYTFIWVALSLANSMMADVVDEYETYSKTRQEGLFFSSLSFAFKCSSGFGAFFAGVLLSLISFPTQAGTENIPQSVIEGLGWIGGPLLMFCYISAVFFLIRYPIDKKRYAEIRAELDK